jgi:hypothetical protein
VCFVCLSWTFGEFTEALCRLAATAYPTRDALSSAKDQEETSMWLAAAVKQLLNEHVLPRAPAPGITVAADVGAEDFRRRVAGSAVRGVHKKFESTLRKLFRHYAKAGQRGEMVVMSLFQLVEFCQVNEATNTTSDHSMDSLPSWPRVVLFAAQTSLVATRPRPSSS